MLSLSYMLESVIISSKVCWRLYWGRTTVTPELAREMSIPLMVCAWVKLSGMDIQRGLDGDDDYGDVRGMIVEWQKWLLRFAGLEPKEG